jgi:hypothetical protein
MRFSDPESSPVNLQGKYAIPLTRAMSHYREIKNATAEVVGVRLVKKISTARAHEAIRDLIVANPTHSYQQLAALLGCSRWLIYRVAWSSALGEREVQAARCGGRNSNEAQEVFRLGRSISFHLGKCGPRRIWRGDAASLASEFEVSEETAGEVLDELRGRRLIERLDAGTYFLSKWRFLGLTRQIRCVEGDRSIR